VRAPSKIMYKLIEDVPLELREWYVEQPVFTNVWVEEVGKVEGYFEKQQTGVEVIQIHVPVVSYQEVEGAIGRRWAREQVNPYLEQAIEYERYNLASVLVPAWEAEYATWEVEQPSRPTWQFDEGGNVIVEVLPAPVKPVADMAARRACYLLVQVPLPEYTNKLTSYEDTFNDETYVTERTFDTEPYSASEMNAIYKNIRDSGRYAPITVLGMTFDCDPESFKNIEGAVRSWGNLIADSQLISAGVVQGDKMYWTLEDNSSVLISKAVLEEVIAYTSIRASLLHVEYTTTKIGS
jgi:hypothetical protein